VEEILVGKSIKMIRKQHNLSQGAFSEMLNIEQASVSRIENGKAFPTLKLCLLISKTFKISLDDLVNGSFFSEENDLSN